MFILIRADEEVLSASNDAKAFSTHHEAWEAMAAEFVDELHKQGYEPGDMTEEDVFDKEDGDYIGSITNDAAYLEHASCRWAIFEVPDFPSPKRNSNVAETVNYECAKDPMFNSGSVLLHKAVVTWNSGKSFACHSPERIELRVGGIPYEYKAV